MRYSIKHEVPGRIRFQLDGKLPEDDAIAFEEIFLALDGVTKAVAYPKAGSVAVWYVATESADLDQMRETVVQEMDRLTIEEVKEYEVADSFALAPRPRHLFHSLASMIAFRLLRKMYLSMPIRALWTLWCALPFWREALRSLRHGRLDVPVLDAAAIAMGFIKGDPPSSSRTMFLLKVGGQLEDYTQRRSESGLVRSLLSIPQQAILVIGDIEEAVPISDLCEGDIVVSRIGDQIPVDGTVLKGAASVNQSSLTGESAAVLRTVGDTVYAGTAIEEGELYIQVMGEPEESKVRAIIKMVEQSQAYKSSDQKRIENIADGLVPWNFLLAAIVAIATRNVERVAAALMVDYSCALQLSGSVAVMAAQQEGAKEGFMVRGSRYFDHMAEADVIVFDKTGTLTYSTPKVAKVVPYGGWERDEVLRLSACLEEHFPHPVARAVVAQAYQEGLEHRERHTDVEYVVAHGIASTLDGERVVIGSEHFILEDEGVRITAAQRKKIEHDAEGTSPLYLAVGGVLRGVIYIEDPPKEGAAEVVQELREVGFKRVIMLTGDSEPAAKRIADAVGITDYQSQLLPEDKYRIVAELQEQGYKVAMVGDGVNDSPALSAAHVSIAMGEGSAVARETADISLVSEDLHALVDLRRMSVRLDQRMRRGYRTTIAINTALLALGVTGVLSPAVSSVIHNGTTILTSISNTRRYLP